MTSSVHSFSNKRESKQEGNIKKQTEMLGSQLEPVVLYWSMSLHEVCAPAGSTGPHQACGSLLALTIINPSKPSSSSK